ncbi:MAG: hypothetical protein KF819_06930 [Labilithrix sp.]|nr:hypothetical protein [Labilithrix sp.]
MTSRFASRGIAVGLASVVLSAFGAAGFACVGDGPVLPPAEDGGANGDAAPADLCDKYCTTVTKNCEGTNRQYRDVADCMRLCALLPQGNAGDRTLDTVACRLANAEVATDRAACAKAGPWGGDACGKRCESFCGVISRSCAKLASPPYVDNEDCLRSACAFTFDPTAGDGPDQDFDGDDTLNCRAFHLMLAIDDALQGHCPHTKRVSDTCMARDAGAD